MKRCHTVLPTLEGWHQTLSVKINIQNLTKMSGVHTFNSGQWSSNPFIPVSCTVNQT